MSAHGTADAAPHQPVFVGPTRARLEQLFDVPASQWMALQVDHDLAEARMRLARA